MAPYGLWPWLTTTDFAQLERDEHQKFSRHPQHSRAMIFWDGDCASQRAGNAKSTCASQRCLAGKPTAHSTCSSIITSARRKGMTMTLRNSLGTRVKESEPHHLQFSKGTCECKSQSIPSNLMQLCSPQIIRTWSLMVTLCYLSHLKPIIYIYTMFLYIYIRICTIY